MSLIDETMVMSQIYTLAHTLRLVISIEYKTDYKKQDDEDEKPVVTDEFENLA